MTALLDEVRKGACSASTEPVLVAPEREGLTREEILREAAAIGSALRNLGIREGTAVAIVLSDGPELIIACLGASQGTVCAPINPGLRESEVAFSLESTGAAAVIVDLSLDSPAAAVASRMGIPVLALTPGDGRIRPQPALRHPPCSVTEATVYPAETALLLHTSGTTSTPKLVPLTHTNIRAMMANTRGILALTAGDTFLAMMPLFHLQGLIGALAQLAAGGKVVCTGGFRAGAFPGWLEEYRPTWYTAGPALHRAALEAGKSDGCFQRARLRFVRSIGAAMPATLREELERTIGAPVLEGYGMTEAGVITSNALSSGGHRAGSAGRTAGLEIAIVDRDGAELPPESDGEIVVRGAAVMRGYAGEHVPNAFINGWFRTGDLGRLDGDGFLYVTGRLKEIINRGGEKILPSEIDEVLKEHPAIGDAAAFPVPHPSLGEDIGVAVVLRPGSTVREAELRQFVDGRLAHFKVPQRFLFVESIPKSATGKPRRSALAEQASAEAAPPATKAPNGHGPLTETERTVNAIWRRVLKTDCAGAADDFFRLGGDSFALAVLVTELETAFGCGKQALEAGGFFAEPTLAALSRIVACCAEGMSPAAGPFVTLQPNGARAPFFCFPGAEENPHGFRALAEHLGPDRPFHGLRDPRPVAERGVFTVEEAAERFAAAILEKCPEGPYLLGGHCYGGILAFEVARQLARAGGDVRLVVLMESPAPGYPKVLRHWKDYVRQTVLALQSGIRPAVLIEHAGFLSKLLWKKARLGLRRTATARPALKPLVNPAADIYDGNRTAARIYRPADAPCPVVQFIAEGEDHSVRILDDPRLAWAEFAPKGFTARRVPGKAAGMFEEPAVGILAERIRELLAAASPAEGIVQPR